MLFKTPKHREKEENKKIATPRHGFSSFTRKLKGQEGGLGLQFNGMKVDSAVRLKNYNSRWEGQVGAGQT